MRYICQICGYVYDDEKEKVPFEQLPADWKCPLCGAVKSDFKPEVPKTEVKASQCEYRGCRPKKTFSRTISCGML